MRFGRPGAQADDFERNGAIETLLMRAVNYALTAPADLLQQFVVAKVSQHFRRARTMTSTRGLRWIGRLHPLRANQDRPAKGKPRKCSAANRRKSLRRTFRKRYQQSSLLACTLRLSESAISCQPKKSFWRADRLIKDGSIVNRALLALLATFVVACFVTMIPDPYPNLYARLALVLEQSPYRAMAIFR
jgi:hypothetical protein